MPSADSLPLSSNGLTASSDFKASFNKLTAALDEHTATINNHVASMGNMAQGFAIGWLFQLGVPETQNRSPPQELLCFFETALNSIAGQVLQAYAGVGDIHPSRVLVRIAERCADEAIWSDGALYSRRYYESLTRGVLGQYTDGLVGKVSQHR
jgi:hypothetical protein